MAITGFNPRTGEWEGIATPSLQRSSSSSTRQPSTEELTSGFSRRNNNSRSSSSSSKSFFTSVNDAFASIGDWIADANDWLRGAAAWLLKWAAWIFGGLGLLGMLLEGHWIVAIVLACLFGALYVAFTSVLATIISWIIFIPVAILRYVFYNFWTFLATAIIVCAAFYGEYNSRRPYYETDDVEVVATSTPLYRCTANVLYVRSEPSTSGYIVGSLFKDDVVEVIDSERVNGFVKILHNGRTAYVSEDYITPNY